MSSTFRTTNSTEPERAPPLPAPSAAAPISVPDPAPLAPRESESDVDGLFDGLLASSSDDGLGLGLGLDELDGDPVSRSNAAGAASAGASAPHSRAGSAGVGGTKRKGAAGANGNGNGDGVPMKKAKAYQHATAEGNGSGAGGSSSVHNWGGTLTATLAMPSTEDHGGLSRTQLNSQSANSFDLDLGQLPTLSGYDQSALQALDFEGFFQQQPSGSGDGQQQQQGQQQQGRAEAEAEALAKLAAVLSESSAQSASGLLAAAAPNGHLLAGMPTDANIDPNLYPGGSAARPQAEIEAQQATVERDLQNILGVPRRTGRKGKGKQRAGVEDEPYSIEVDGLDDDADGGAYTEPRQPRQRPQVPFEHTHDGNIPVNGPSHELSLGTSISSGSIGGGGGGGRSAPATPTQGNNAVIPTAREAATAFQGDEERPHACPNPECDKKFSRKSDFLRHYRIHTGERPFVCSSEGCTKSFIQRSALTVHMRVHSGDKPHACVECSRMFSDSSSLARHRRVHAGLKPFKCDLCGIKAFSRKATLTRHQVICTGGGDRLKNLKAPEIGVALAHRPVTRPHKPTPEGTEEDEEEEEEEEEEEDVDQLVDHETGLVSGSGSARRLSRPSPPQPQQPHPPGEMPAQATSDTRTEVQPVPRPSKEELDAFGIDDVSEEQQAAVRLLVGGFT